MKNKLVLMMSLLLWLGMFSACSSDDENKDNKSAQALLIGKWRLASDMEYESDPSTDFVEFCENGTVIFEYGVGTDDYRHEESQFVFENDWGFSEGIAWFISGHFQLKSGVSHDEVQRYSCLIIDGSRLRFGPDGGDKSWLTSPYYYIRVT